MTIQNKFLSTLAIGGVLISSASGLMVVNAQTASSATTDSISMAAKKGQKSRKNGLGATVQTALINQDYQAWKTAIAMTPNGTQILAKVDTQAKFNTLSEAQKSVKAAQESRNKVIADLGLTELMQTNRGKAGKMGMMKNQNYQNTPNTNK